MGLICAAIAAAVTIGVSGAALAQVAGVVRIQQVSTGRYVDAYVAADQDYRIVTRAFQDNDTQLWRLTHLGGGNFTIQQVSTGRYWDAYDYEAEDFRLATRTAQNNDTQRWRLITQGNGIYTIIQISTGRFADAHESTDRDFQLVTRTFQNDDSQRWRIEGVSSIKNCLPIVNFCF